MRCKNGTRRNKKTGNCEDKNTIVKRFRCSNGFKQHPPGSGNCVKNVKTKKVARQEVKSLTPKIKYRSSLRGRANSNNSIRKPKRVLSGVPNSNIGFLGEQSRFQEKVVSSIEQIVMDNIFEAPENFRENIDITSNKIKGGVKLKVIYNEKFGNYSRERYLFDIIIKFTFLQVKNIAVNNQDAFLVEEHFKKFSDVVYKRIQAYEKHLKSI